MCIIQLPESATDVQFCCDFICAELSFVYNKYKSTGRFYTPFLLFCIGSHRRTPCTDYSWIYNGRQYNFKICEYLDGTWVCKCTNA